MRLKEKGLSFEDGGKTLSVESGQTVSVRVDGSGTERDVDITPVSWVCAHYISPLAYSEYSSLPCPMLSTRRGTMEIRT